MELLNLVFGTCGNTVGIDFFFFFFEKPMGIELELKEFLIFNASYMNSVKQPYVKILKEEQYVW